MAIHISSKSFRDKNVAPTSAAAVSKDVTRRELIQFPVPSTLSVASGIVGLIREPNFAMSAKASTSEPVSFAAAAPSGGEIPAILVGTPPSVSVAAIVEAWSAATFSRILFKNDDGVRACNSTGSVPFAADASQRFIPARLSSALPCGAFIQSAATASVPLIDRRRR